MNENVLQGGFGFILGIARINCVHVSILVVFLVRIGVHIKQEHAIFKKVKLNLDLRCCIKLIQVTCM